LSSSAFANDTALFGVSRLSLHDALPISSFRDRLPVRASRLALEMHHDMIANTTFRADLFCRQSAKELPQDLPLAAFSGIEFCLRSEEHTSELQSRENLVCRLLLVEKKYP